MPAVDEVSIFGSWAGAVSGRAPPPNDVDVAVISDSLTRFDLAEVRPDLENESRLSVSWFVLAPSSDRLAELRAGSVPVFERAAA